MVSLALRNVTYTRVATTTLAVAAVFSVVVIVFGFVALFAPDTMLPPGDAADSATKFFGGLVAARNIPLGLAALYVIVRRGRLDPTTVLALSGIVQFGDTIVGLSRGVASMAVSAGVGAIVYVAAAASVSTTRRDHLGSRNP